MESVITNTRRVPAVVAMSLAGCISLFAQNNFTAKGVVVDATGEPIPGATVVVKGNTGIGMTTDIDGNFSLKVPSEKTTLVISFVGMKSQEVRVQKGAMNVVLEEDNALLEEVVVVGYGQQKKASVVGAITQTTGETLTRAAGINDIGNALTGNLPGVVTMASSGMPGDDKPQIVIRGASSWNGSSPLVLVDGVERDMNSVDMQSVASLSVLKDASATAVYGVRGANGVILITTKRGQEGRAQINVTANATMKVPSKLPGKLDSYDAMLMRNIAAENELNIAPGAWQFIKPQQFIDNYRNQDPTAVDEFGNLLTERYPNVDWQDALFDKYCMSYNANLNVSGGTKFVKYFASVDFVSEGDIYKDFQSGRGYDTGYDYKRFNMRSNLDFALTKTTSFKVNLAGMTGIQKSPWSNSVNNDWQVSQQWSGIYNIGPDVFVPRYEDGSWGFLPHGTNVTNSAESIATGGQQEITQTKIQTDFILDQNLDFITKGLNLQGMLSFDNNFKENQRGIYDLYTPIQHKWINPETGEVTMKQPYEAYDKFDYSVGRKWDTRNGSVDDRSTYRSLYYKLALNWTRSFGKNNLSALGVFERSETATGSEIPHYRESWAGRVTYDYAMRYNIEFNGAYNGSEKFASDYRFGFFPSGAVGWTISEEPFMKTLKDSKIIDMLKLRASYGEIGDDSYWERWLYMSTWAYGGQTAINSSGSNSPYSWYREEKVGNPDIHWEVVRKLNLGLDYSFLDGMFAGAFDLFQDKRSDVIIGGRTRAIPAFLGVSPSAVNKGKVTSQGYEIELRFNKVLANRMRIWANASMTHAENKIDLKDDAPLLPDYQKEAGFQISQNKGHLDYGNIQNQDELYASTKHISGDNQKLVGDYNVIDFNGDGTIDDFDAVPYGHARIPQNTFNCTLGWEWKGWSANIQFYGVTNVTRPSGFTSLSDVNQANVYDQGNWWAQNHSDFNVVTPRMNSTPTYYECTQFMYDGSYCRLKNAEVAYTFKNEWTKKAGLSNVRLYISGNNLAVWSHMPDDRESNFSSDGGATGAYPTMRRINFGIKFSL